MLHKKAKKKSSNAKYASIKKEMAKPRMAKSARVAELNLDTARIHEQPSTTIPGIVGRIIPSTSSNQPEKAQMVVDVPERRYRNLRIENILIDEHGNDVRLKMGTQVTVTVTAKDVNDQSQRKQPNQLGVRQSVWAFVRPQFLESSAWGLCVARFIIL